MVLCQVEILDGNDTRKTLDKNTLFKNLGTFVIFCYKEVMYKCKKMIL